MAYCQPASFAAIVSLRWQEISLNQRMHRLDAENW
jgi:hypothetical protein